MLEEKKMFVDEYVNMLMKGCDEEIIQLGWNINNERPKKIQINL